MHACIHKQTHTLIIYVFECVRVCAHLCVCERKGEGAPVGRDADVSLRSSCVFWLRADFC